MGTALRTRVAICLSVETPVSETSTAVACVVLDPLPKLLEVGTELATLVG